MKDIEKDPMWHSKTGERTRAILDCLRQDRHGKSFTQLKNELNLHPQTLNICLRYLLKRGLIYKYSRFGRYFTTI